MKTVNILIIVIIALLSIAAGAAKVMQTPEEMAFLQGVGLNKTLIIVFGVVQIAAGILLAAGKTRFLGAILSALAFAASAILLFVGGNLAFGLFSIVPVALAGYVIHQSASTASTT
jgi:hypothetical protein